MTIHLVDHILDHLSSAFRGWGLESSLDECVRHFAQRRFPLTNTLKGNEPLSGINAIYVGNWKSITAGYLIFRGLCFTFQEFKFGVGNVQKPLRRS